MKNLLSWNEYQRKVSCGELHQLGLIQIESVLIHLLPYFFSSLILYLVLSLFKSSSFLSKSTLLNALLL